MNELTNKKKNILVVEDNLINRKVLTMIISESYDCIEATNGQEALDALEQNKDTILAVMLDIVMPVMDGYEFLKEIKKHDEYNNIPIIVTTCKDSEENEIKALELGAWDFVSKPYEANIISFRLQNAIKRSQLLETEKLSYVLTYDQVTGLYNKQNFFLEARKLLDIYNKNEFAIYRIDIDKFKYINFGSTDGDKVIEIFVNALRYIMSNVPCCTFGRMDTESFALCFSEIFLDAETFTNALTEKIDKSLGDYNIEINLGINKIDDNSESIESAYEKASFAADQCKADPYSKYIYYDKYLHEKVMRKTSLLKAVYSEFSEGNFSVEYFPQYSSVDNRLCGAEAIIIWNSSQNGKVYPNEYLDLVRNDLIANIDTFVVEEVCKNLNTNCNFPITIKLSNYTAHNPALIDRIEEIIDDNGVEHSRICFDVSEKAFDIEEHTITDSVTSLIMKDFKVQVSDFGKGKSSLNALASVLFSKIKIDPSFMLDLESAELGKSFYDVLVDFSEEHGVGLVVENKNYDTSKFGSGNHISIQNCDYESLLDRESLSGICK